MNILKYTFSNSTSLQLRHLDPEVRKHKDIIQKNRHDLQLYFFHSHKNLQYNGERTAKPNSLVRVTHFFFCKPVTCYFIACLQFLEYRNSFVPCWLLHATKHSYPFSCLIKAEESCSCSLHKTTSTPVNITETIFLIFSSLRYIILEIEQLQLHIVQDVCTFIQRHNNFYSYFPNFFIPPPPPTLPSFKPIFL